MTSRPSPRTPAQPMAFTAREFWRGALVSCLSFNLLFLVVTAVILTVASGSLQGFVSILIFVAWFQLVAVVAVSAVATLIGSAAAFGLGLLLRTVTSMRRHLAAFAALGILVAGAVVAIVGVWPVSEIDGYGSLLHHITEPYITLPLLAVSAVSVAFGWYWTASRALDGDHAPESPFPETQLAD